MRTRESIEFEWYIRDCIFRYFNVEGSRIEIEKIIDNISKYLRYRGINKEYLKDLFDQTLQELNSNVIIKDNESIIINSKLRRYRCEECKYVFYIGSIEEMKCPKCNSNRINEFNIKV